AEEQRKKGSNQTGNAAGMGANYPMYYINWADCHDFCQKLSSLTDEGEYRLPTEAEWEYACRAGTTTPFSPDRPLNQEVNNNDDQAVVEDGEQPAGQLREVKSSQPNAWGLYDMHGNVREWCSDWYADYPTGCITDPTGPKRGACRVNRGGSWESPDSVCRSASRSKELPMFRYSNLGFRILLVPTE
ncbi:MAG: formylglycine-generating enzyme family protein, partial [Thermoguttaceae bacterium]|nr:formylglycine-generating enzyme family protein [Thermoguttaceae bacterium]